VSKVGCFSATANKCAVAFVTLANPLGPPARGWEQVAEVMGHAASTHRDGELTSIEIVAKHVTPELAYVVEIERLGGQAWRNRGYLNGIRCPWLTYSLCRESVSVARDRAKCLSCEMKRMPPGKSSRASKRTSWVSTSR
jgi:hypothetical protein